MGNNSTKESRGAEVDHRHHHRAGPQTLDPLGTSSHASQDSHRPTSRQRNARTSRPDLAFLGIGGNNGGPSNPPDAPFERRETKQEREARRLERERIAREKERERSMKEEHVDGGYLVTMGIYTGVEDFNKAIVRQLQVRRRQLPPP